MGSLEYSRDHKTVSGGQTEVYLPLRFGRVRNPAITKVITIFLKTNESLKNDARGVYAKARQYGKGARPLDAE
ncbi:hypothetical protein FACS1894159_10380 [Bacteroidia bacterium]|nr:hypothetical protein FACS1894159_10380 [Bacteroidia bacterium]